MRMFFLNNDGECFVISATDRDAAWDKVMEGYLIDYFDCRVTRDDVRLMSDGCRIEIPPVSSITFVY